MLQFTPLGDVDCTATPQDPVCQAIYSGGAPVTGLNPSEHTGSWLDSFRNVVQEGFDEFALVGKDISNGVVGVVTGSATGTHVTTSPDPGIIAASGASAGAAGGVGTPPIPWLKVTLVIAGLLGIGLLTYHHYKNA